MALSPPSVDISKTFGALLLGGLFASLLSGLVIVQVVVYFKLYPRDTRSIKALVLAVWFLDTCHTAFIWAALWGYIIEDYGRVDDINDIHWTVAMTIIMTAILTFFVHIFFASRIILLSKQNFYLTAPIITLAILRLVSASVTTAEMLHLQTFSRFKSDIRWVFTTGLALSTAVDILITGSLFVLLQSSRADAPGLTAVIDTLIRYAFETGSLTCAGTVISMICWLSMPNNLIFLGLHFVIGKLYANSLLVTLNTRDKIRRSRSQYAESGGMPVHFLDTRRHREGVDSADQHVLGQIMESKSSKGQIITQLEVNVERSIVYESEV